MKLNKILINKKIMDTILFILFFFIAIIFSLIRIETLPTADVWYHLTLSSDIVEDGILSKYEIYNSKIAFHFLLAIASIFSNYSTYLIYKGIGIIQIPLALVTYNQLLDTIKLKLAIKRLVLIAYLFTAFGTILNHIQAWPSSFCISLGFTLFVNFFQYQKKKVIFTNHKYQSQEKKNLYSYYFQQFIILLNISILHIVNIFIFTLPLIFILIFFFKSQPRKYFIEIFTYTIFLVIHTILNPSLFNTLSITLIFTNHPLYVIMLLILALIMLVITGIWFLDKFIQKSTYNVENPLKEKFYKNNSSIKIEEKYFWKIIIPILVLLFPIFFYFLILNTKTFFPINILTMIVNFEFEAIIVSILIITILIFRHYDLTGKLIYIFLVFFITFTFFLIFFSQVYSITIRFVNLSYPVLLMNLGLYIKYIRRHRSIPKLKQKILTFTCIYLATSIMYHASYNEFISNHEANYWQEINNINSSQGENHEHEMIIGSFYWKYCVNYLFSNGSVYNTPFESKYLYYLHLENQFQNNSNVLYEFKQQHNLDELFLFISQNEREDGILTQNRENLGVISQTEYDQYCNQKYLNRIAIGENYKNLYYLIN